MAKKSLFVIVFVVFLVTGLAFTGWNLNPVGAILSGLYLLILPGFTVVAATFPPGKLSTAERGIAALGLSLATVVVGSLLLNVLPGGLEPRSWVVLLDIVILVAATVAYKRHHPITPVNVRENRSFSITLVQAVLISTTVALVLGAVLLADLGARQPIMPGFTQFWALPQHGSKLGAFQIGIINTEAIPLTYYIKLEVNGSLVYQSQLIPIDPDQSWETSLELPFPRPVSVYALLYRTDQPQTSYRQLLIHLEP